MTLARGSPGPTAPLPIVALACALALASLACSDDEPEPTRPDRAPAPHERAPASPDLDRTSALGASDRAVYFGDLHVHTAWSFDAYDYGVRAGPEAAYRFARGEAIPHAAGGTIQLVGPPLDFLAVTDHAEYLGVAAGAMKEEHALHRQPLIQSLRADDPRLVEMAARRIRQSLAEGTPFPALVADDVLPPAWQEVVALANAHDDPGRFTAFIGFEYSANPDRQNLHRNVLFRSDRVPAKPFSAFDSENPEDLWAWMDAARARGEELIAIPHNGNGSNGLMFADTRFDGSPLDAAWAERRIRNEPVAELIQIKGQSDTTPRLSPADPWADFEVVPWQTLAPNRASREHGSYVREAQGRGLALEARLGRDPFALGVVGSSDGHNAASPVVESSYFGKLGRADGSPAARLARGLRGPSPVESLDASAYWSAAGLAGIWASANTRAALFDALRRRETFATSGPRIRVEVFAGFEGREAQRVPMGGTLVPHAGDESPRFWLAAHQDPLEAPLERLQIIKLAPAADGSVEERVFDVACAQRARPDPETARCPEVANEPDLETCAVQSETGSPELRAEWRDPSFEPRVPSLYIVRVLQIPTCRWSRFDALRAGLAPPSELPDTIQERAISSPIWVRHGSRGVAQ